MMMITGRTVLALFALSLTALVRPAAAPPATSFPNVPGRSNATPSIAASGSFVAVAWGASAEGKADVFVAVSRDSGTTFAAPVRVNRIPGEARLSGEMPPRVALYANSSKTPQLVVLWVARTPATEIKSARSRDGGRTFDSPIALQASGAAGDRGWPALTVGRNGQTHAIWLDHRGLAAARAAAGGRSGHQPGARHDGVAMARNSGLYYASADKGGGSERELTSGVCYCCKTAFAAGTGDVLYAAWRHVYPGSFRDMAFTSSRDGGKSFAPPLRVSEDGWAVDACPDDGPALAVDGGGTVHLIWPTVIGDAPQGALFYAASRDARTFSARVRVPTLGGPKPSHPQIAVDAGGRIFVAWDEVVDKRHVAAMREVKPGANGAAAFGEITTLSPGPGMYPALAWADKKIVAVWTTGGSNAALQFSAIDRR